MKKLFVLVFLLLSFDISCFKINRVILATNANPMYLDFWPLVAKAWQKVVGIRPTLALIADESVKVDETLGDVIRFEPIPGVPTSLQAQVIRLLLPAYFENDFCILSDIDMLPLNKNYFLDSAAPYNEDTFVAYRDAAYGGLRFPMCYVAARGSTFKEIFGINKLEDIPNIITQWNALGHNWNTDEIMMFEIVSSWNKYKSHCVTLGHNVTRRICRSNWTYNPQLIIQGYYIDSHLLRPYNVHKHAVDAVARLAGIID